MAELNTSRNKKAVPKVDLTAMVDLAFLLITFFMLTTSLSKPVAMDIAKPDQEINAGHYDFPASRSMTILLGKENQMAWYMGENGKDVPVVENLAGIRQALKVNKLKVDEANGNQPEKSLCVIVKPTAGAKYKNFVDVMDELHIAQITVAPAIDDNNITTEEQDFMKSRRIL
ncbi:ExbD/TolR family protein [Pedobacter sp.]|uniref:ExbD/TolR family protein n=1 Tax=Pedobacter sp. TaxID=1411316 RepID=UPI003D7F4162